MSEARTVPTSASVDAFIAGVEHDGRREDALALAELMETWTGWKPRMWGPSIIGFGRYDYTYESGHSGTSCVVGFSPRKANMVVYVLPGYSGFQDQLARLGKHKTGASCLYINKLADVDMGVLEEIVQGGVDHMRKTYKTWDA